jgi:hypothetical protein
MRAVFILVALAAQALAEAPQTVYAPAAPASEYGVPAAVPEKLPEGYSVQTGYEGYLVPAEEEVEAEDHDGGILLIFILYFF